MSQLTADQAWEIGSRLHHEGRLAQAEEVYRKVLAAEPGHVKAMHMLGVVMLQTHRYDQAIQWIDRAVRSDPLSAQTHNNLAMALQRGGQIDRALEHFAKAVELKINYSPAWSNMGNLYLEQARHAEAEHCFHQALNTQQDYPEIASGLLYLMHFRPEHDAAAILREHQKWARQYAKAQTEPIKPHANSRDPERVLRIGYVSPDFREHPVGRFLLPLFANHDRERFEIWCYSRSAGPPDELGQLLQNCAKTWRRTYRLSEAVMEQSIRDDGIDILVDLSQHSAGNQLLLFARKPAPIQVAYLGYPGTTGLEAMDYRLTDPYLDPPGQGDEFYTEKSVRLPHCFWCYQAPPNSPDVQPAPASRNRHVTFGCLNRFAKITRPTLEWWIRILQNVPNSRLLIHSQIGDHLIDVRRLFESSGIAARRVEFVEKKSHAQYLAEFGRIDIALDPYPHGGGTVTCDGLWMGVPVVTLRGQTAVGRGGASLLSNVGLPELIAQTPDEYVEIAAELAGDVDKLQNLRAGMRQRMLSSPLMDAPHFAADVEAAYRQMWRAWCEQKPATPIQT